MKPPMEVQGINRQMNLHGGVNLNTLAGLPVDYPDPKDGYGTLYAPATAWKGVADALREEKLKGGRTLYRKQYNLNPYLGNLLQYWAAPHDGVGEEGRGCGQWLCQVLPGEPGQWGRHLSAYHALLHGRVGHVRLHHLD